MYLNFKIFIGVSYVSKGVRKYLELDLNIYIYILCISAIFQIINFY